MSSLRIHIIVTSNVYISIKKKPQGAWQNGSLMGRFLIILNTGLQLGKDNHNHRQKPQENKYYFTNTKT